jgi:hypothetical protein
LNPVSTSKDYSPPLQSDEITESDKRFFFFFGQILGAAGLMIMGRGWKE